MPCSSVPRISNTFPWNAAFSEWEQSSIAKDLHLEEVSIFEILHFQRKVYGTHHQKSELVRFSCFPNNVLNKSYLRKIPLAAALSPTPILDADCHSNYSQTIQEAVFVSVLTQKWNVKGTAID